MRSQVDVFLQESAESWRSFTDPALIVECDAAESVRSVVADVERLTRDRQLHAVGFLTYEAGAAFGFRMPPKNPRLPVAWFALFEPQHVRALTQPETGGGVHARHAGAVTRSHEVRCCVCQYSRSPGCRRHLSG